MESQFKVLHVDAGTGFYQVERLNVGEFYGPVDLGLHFTEKYDSLNIGTGLLCGSILGGSNRLVFTGNSPCWGGFFISSMGGAGLVFDNLGLNMFTIRGRAESPSLLYLNRVHGEEVQVEIHPLDLDAAWSTGRTGVYGLMSDVYERFKERYVEEPRILATGPAALCSDIGAIVSVPIKNGELTHVDTWAGRGGFGSKMLAQHGIAAVIYGGTYVDEDFRDRKVANSWFEQRYNKKMAAKDMEATTKYRFDPDLKTGGTLGVNYAKMGDKLIAFNYRTLNWPEKRRSDVHRELILGHYLKQFNEEMLAVPKSQSMKNCGEPCVALCKKMHGEFKKDYEPYQTMGPLIGVFDQRAAERVNHCADANGFDAISAGGVLAWLMDCLDGGLIDPTELGVTSKPQWETEGFDPVKSSQHNADLAIELLNAILEKRGIDLSGGAREAAWKIAGEKGNHDVVDRFVYTANGNTGWMVPNQYWTPGALAPMAIMGKYYMYYGGEFFEPRELGRKCAERMIGELVLDNSGFCRFHRMWAEEMVPDILEKLYGEGTNRRFKETAAATAVKIHSRNVSVMWESDRNIEFVRTFLARAVEHAENPPEILTHWLERFEGEPKQAAVDFWYDIRKGIDDVLSARRLFMSSH